MTPSLKTVLPTLVLGIGLLATTGLVAVRPAPARRVPQVKPPLVHVLEVQPRSARLPVRAHGNVEPRTESDLVVEVPGRIVWVSPNLDEGSFFAAGEVLARLDRRDQDMAVERGSAAVQRAESRLELAQATLARRSSLERAGVGSAAALDEARSAERVAVADLRDARAALAQARLDLARTRVSAPFDGRVRAKHVDVGQFVARGAPAARVYAVDYAEVRLPIPNDELAFLDLSLGHGGAGAPAQTGEGSPATQAAGPGVTLIGSFAGVEQRWNGNVVRTDGALDPRTRMVNVVVRVEDPYGRTSGADRLPLPVGLFVAAEIEGREYRDVFELPRSALRGRDRVVVIDGESRMASRRVELLRADGETIWIRSGLSPGERVCTTPLEVVVEGMAVRVAEAETGPEVARGTGAP